MAEINNKRKASRILVVSLAFNALLLAMVAVLAYHYEVFIHVGDHIANWKSPTANLDSDEISYLTRETLFELLPTRKHPIVFLGDSQTANCEWDELFAGAVNRGIGGDTSAGLVKRISAVTQLQPRAVFLMIGANDFARGVQPKETADNIRLAVAKIRESSPGTEVYIQSITPTWRVERNRFAKQVNQIIASMADGKTLSYLDFYRSFLDGEILNPKYSYDGIHLNGAGMMVWKQLLTPYVTSLLASNNSSPPEVMREPLRLTNMYTLFVSRELP
jgi:lysophospholipase L1-like esterase